jgi:hypothetical protein
MIRDKITEKKGSDRDMTENEFWRNKHSEM